MNTLTIRKRLHAYIDLIQDTDLDILLWCVQGFAARTLNKKHNEEVKPDEAHQD